MKNSKKVQKTAANTVLVFTVLFVVLKNFIDISYR